MHLRLDRQRLAELLKLPLDRRPANVRKTMARKAGGEPPFTNEVERFQADVITSDWPAVKKFLATLPARQAGRSWGAAA